MSQSVRLLSEDESAAAAEVSVETIRKYRDCGLLDPVLKDNQTYFQEVDIQTLFFTKFQRKNGEGSEATATSGAAQPASNEPRQAAPQTGATTSAASDVRLNSTSQPTVASSPAAAAQPAPVSNGGEPSVAAVAVTPSAASPQTSMSPASDGSKSSSSSAVTGPAEATAIPTSQPKSADLQPATAAKSASESVATASGSTSTSGDAARSENPRSENLRTENVRSENVRSENVRTESIRPEVVESASSSKPFESDEDQAGPSSASLSSSELIELNKSLRDQIQMMREERDWLRDRIEKLESRSEREQMLLLSESENVRKLISATQKSFWQRALPWLGDNKK
ncbi:MAG: hypothetical protein U0136_02820 [Bdellovibrionota bacterium]